MIKSFVAAIASLLLSTNAAAQQPRPAAAAVVAPQPILIGEVHRLNSRVLGQERRIAVRLPTGYSEKPNARYDVVYLIDGGPEQDFPHIAGLAQSAEVNGTFEPFILVGIETVKRRQEITPAVADPAPYNAELGVTPGGSANFRRFIAEEIKPWVEARYRTSGRDSVMGESLAGLFVVETLFEAPQLFDDYIAVSPSLWWERMKYGRDAAAYLRRLAPGERRLYLTLADEGYWHEQGVEALVAGLKKAAPARSTVDVCAAGEHRDSRQHLSWRCAGRFPRFLRDAVAGFTSRGRC
jgi:predicted alpha/beta superfamily hydrolase